MRRVSCKSMNVPVQSLLITLAAAIIIAGSA
jgi:hypothetical protein